MADFKSLRNARKSKSYVPQTKAPVEEVTAAVTTETSSAEIMDVEETTTSAASEVYDAEGLYTSIPSTLEIRTTQSSGRGLFAKAIYNPGDILFSVKPHGAALSLSHLDGYCSSCFGAGSGDADEGGLKRCTGCLTVRYCSPACQKKDWSFHKNECIALRNWLKSAAEHTGSSSNSESSGEPRPPSDALRCLGRILWKRQKLGSSHAWTKEYDNMQSHRQTLSKETSGSFTSEVHTHLAHGVVAYLGLTSPDQLEAYDIHSAADLVDLVSRFTTNTFTVTSPTLSPLGACVAPSVALINHSCDPNAVVVFPRSSQSKMDEPLMQVVALKPIQPGEEVLTSYIDTTLPRGMRMQTLRETYHFTCHCPLCIPGEGAATKEVDAREAMLCPKRCGGVCCLPTEQDSEDTRCTKCGAAIRDVDAVLDAVRIGQEALEKAERVQFEDPRKALQLTENLSQILISAGLIPSAHPLLALTRLCTSLLIHNLSPPASSTEHIEQVYSPQLQEQQENSTHVGDGETSTNEDRQKALDEAIRCAARVCAGLGQVLVYGHPVRGVASAELGKLLSVDEPSPRHVQQHPQQPPNTSTGASMVTTVVYPPSGPKRLQLALETLVQARGELLVGFGRANGGGEVGREVREMAVGVEKELGVWRSRVRDVKESG